MTYDFLHIGDLFERHFDLKPENIYSLKADGSDRKIFRITSKSGITAVGVNNIKVEENHAFIEFTKHFLSYGLKVPNIYKISDDYTEYLIEDLGDATLFSAITNFTGIRNDDFIKSYYIKAIEELTKFQIIAGPKINFNLCYQHKEFAEASINFDLNYFAERFLKVFHKNPIDFAMLNDDFNYLRNKLLESERKYFLYRDFQSRNIMIKDGWLYFIDYQSGRKGALQYDLASLLYDAKANLSNQLREELLHYYVEYANRYISVNDENFKTSFWYYCVVRILQALGAYGFLGVVKGKDKFLDSIPYAINNLRHLLENKIEKTELNYLRKLMMEFNYE
jgi:aminoglycoside/choline kinase family phosphotransferase